MMQGFYLLAMQQARRRTLLARAGMYRGAHQHCARRTRAAVRACRSGERSN